MSKFWTKLTGLFSNKTFVGVDREGNRYFIRNAKIDGIMKEKRSVVFKGDVDSNSIPVEWTCWLNGQRKLAPTPEEMAILEARRVQVRENVALLKKEEEERKAKLGTSHNVATGKVVGPDLKSFIQQFPTDSEGNKIKQGLEEAEKEKNDPIKTKLEPESSEPSGSGASFRPGTWQPPT